MRSAKKEISCYIRLAETDRYGSVRGENEMLKKAHKILRSRYLWAVFVIVLEFAQLLAVFMLLFEYFLPITVMGIVFHVGVLLHVINKDEIPEFKIPWLIILFLELWNMQVREPSFHMVTARNLYTVKPLGKTCIST